MTKIFSTFTTTLDRIISILIGAVTPPPAPVPVRVRARRPEADRCLR
jgi:hypothetical protein